MGLSWSQGSFWQLLTGATPVAPSPLPKPRHTSSKWFETVFTSKQVWVWQDEFLLTYSFEITEVPVTSSWKLRSQLNVLEEVTCFASLENRIIFSVSVILYLLFFCSPLFPLFVQSLVWNEIRTEISLLLHVSTLPPSSWLYHSINSGLFFLLLVFPNLIFSLFSFPLPPEGGWIRDDLQKVPPTSTSVVFALTPAQGSTKLWFETLC